MMERKLDLDRSRCARTLIRGTWPTYKEQCSRKVWKDGWCKQHHPDNVKARHAELDRSAMEKWNNTPQMRLVRAGERIATLEWLLSCPKHDSDHPLTYVLLCLDEEQITFAKACEAIRELAQGKTPVLPEGVCRTSGKPISP